MDLPHPPAENRGRTGQPQVKDSADKELEIRWTSPSLCSKGSALFSTDRTGLSITDGVRLAMR
jgi:hypothetical protein